MGLRLKGQSTPQPGAQSSRACAAVPLPASGARHVPRPSGNTQPVCAASLPSSLWLQHAKRPVACLASHCIDHRIDGFQFLFEARRLVQHALRCQAAHLLRVLRRRRGHHAHTGIPGQLHRKSSHVPAASMDEHALPGLGMCILKKHLPGRNRNHRRPPPAINVTQALGFPRRILPAEARAYSA